MRRKFGIYWLAIALIVIVVIFGGGLFLRAGKINTSISVLAVAVPKTTVKVKAETDGKIEDLFIELGDTVEKGQFLARLDNSSSKHKYNQALLIYEESKERLNELRYEYSLIELQRKLAVLSAQKIVLTSQKVYDNLKNKPLPATLLAAQQSLAQANFMVEQAKRTLDVAKQSGDESQIASAENNYQIALSMQSASTQQIEKLKEGATEEELTSAETDIQSAKMSLQLNKANFANRRKLLSNRIRMEEIRLKESEAAYQEAKRKMESIMLKTPISGIVISVAREVDDMIREGMIICEIADTSNIVFDARIPESVASNIYIEQPVKIFLTNAINEDEYILGRIEKILPMMIRGKNESVLQTFISIKKDGATDIQLRLGATAKVVIETGNNSILTMLAKGIFH